MFSSNLDEAIQIHLEYWKKQKVKRVTVLFNNPNYGAYFKTVLIDQGQEGHLGRTRFLKQLIPKLHQNHIEVYAWFYPFRSKIAWEKHSDWRAPNCSFKNEYLLDVERTDVQLWYHRLIAETLKEFPNLDGVDIAEPMSVQDCVPAKITRTKALTRFFQHLSTELIGKNKKLSLTPSWAVSSDGKLWSSFLIKDHFGVDLIEMLKTIQWNSFFPQLQYKQWEVAFHDPHTFNPKWTALAYQALEKTLRSSGVRKVPMGIHLELGQMENREFNEVLSRLELKKSSNIVSWLDVYDSHLAIQKKTNLQSALKSFHHQKY